MGLMSCVRANQVFYRGRPDLRHENILTIFLVDVRSLFESEQLVGLASHSDDDEA